MITMTPVAYDYLKQMIAKQNGLGFRISIKKTGCSGYSYASTIVNEKNESDLLVEQEGIKIFLDSAWLSILTGIQIDYVEENKSGLKQKRLVFTNPNESSRCGCGESFHTEK